MHEVIFTDIVNVIVPFEIPSAMRRNEKRHNKQTKPSEEKSPKEGTPFNFHDKTLF